MVDNSTFSSWLTEASLVVRLNSPLVVSVTNLCRYLFFKLPLQLSPFPVKLVNYMDPLSAEMSISFVQRRVFKWQQSSFPFLVCWICQIILNMGLLFKQIQVYIKYLYQFGNAYLCTKFQYTSTNYYLYYMCTKTGSKAIYQIQQT